MKIDGARKRKRTCVLVVGAVFLGIILAAAFLREGRTVNRSFQPVATTASAVVFEVSNLAARSTPIFGKKSGIVLAEAAYFGPYYVISNELFSAKRGVRYDETNGVLLVTVEKKAANDWKFQLILTNVTSLFYRRSNGEAHKWRLRSRKEIWTSESLDRQTGG